MNQKFTKRFREQDINSDFFGAKFIHLSLISEVIFADLSLN